VDEERRLKMTFLNPGVFCGNSVNYILVNDNKIGEYYLLGLLNSSLLNWYFKVFSANSNVNCYEVNNFPIVLVSRGAQGNIKNLVGSILSAKQGNPQADTSELETKIDQMVYDLYDLTDKEIAIIEGKGE
ncbi:unnamed protein product, partial [marine sediment metagenome]